MSHLPPAEELFRTAPAWRGIRYVEHVPSSPIEELRDDGSRAIRTFFTLWNDRFPLAQNLVGYASVVGTGSGRHLSRTTPHPYPGFADTSGRRPFLFATEVQRIEPWGLDVDEDGEVTIKETNPLGTIARYGLAKLTVLYESLTYEILDDDDPACQTAGLPDESRLARYVTFDVNPSAEILNMPFNSLVYVGGGTVPGQPGKLLPQCDFSVTWHRVPKEAIGSKLVNPTAASTPIDSTLGKMNAATFAGQAKGTVLLNAVTLRPIRSALGDRLYDVTYRFLFIPQGHYSLMKVDTSTGAISFPEVVVAGGAGTTNLNNQTDGINVYNWADYSLLFKPA